MKKFSQTLKILTLLCLIISGQMHTTQLPKLTKEQLEETTPLIENIAKQAEAFNKAINGVKLSDSAQMFLMLKWFQQGQSLGDLDIETFAENAEEAPGALISFSSRAEEFAELVNDYVNSEHSKEERAQLKDQIASQYKNLQNLSNSSNINRLFIKVNKSLKLKQFAPMRQGITLTARRMRFSQVQVKSKINYKQIYLAINKFVLYILSWGAIATSFFGALSFYNANFEEDPAVVKNLYIRGSTLFVSMGAISIGSKVLAEIQEYLQKRWAKKDPEWKNMSDTEFAEFVALKVTEALRQQDEQEEEKEGNNQGNDQVFDLENQRGREDVGDDEIRHTEEPLHLQMRQFKTKEQTKNKKEEKEKAKNDARRRRRRL